MADPRNVVSFEGLDYHAETYAHDDTIVYNALLPGGAAQIGLAVTIESAGTVTLVGDGERVEGRLTKVEGDGKCSVQTRGYMKLPGGTAATLTVGLPIVGDLLVAAEGYVQTAPSDAAGARAGRGAIVDATTTTAVVVHLT